MINTAGDVAEQMVKMSLEGVEVAAKISGAGAKQVAAILYSVLKEQKKTTGKMRLTGMLKSGKELKVFAIKRDDLKEFTREAKRYGVLYCVLRDKDKTNEFCDLMVRAEDASKINRIFERFKFASVDEAEIKTQIEKKMKTDGKKEDLQQDMPKKSREEKIVDELLEGSRAQNTNPTTALAAERLPPSEPTSRKEERNGRVIGNEKKKKSVRKELEEIKKEQKGKDTGTTKKINKHKNVQKRRPSRKKKAKARERS